MDEYFKIDAISNSKLSLINKAQGGSAILFKNGFDEEKKYKKSLEMGTNIHLGLLEPDKFCTMKNNKPSGKLGDIIDDVYALRKQQYKLRDSIDLAVENHTYQPNWKPEKKVSKVVMDGLPYYLELVNTEDKIRMTKDVKERVDKCLLSVRSNEEASMLLRLNFRDANYEDVILWNEIVPTDALWYNGEEKYDDFHLNLRCKAKIDCWYVDHKDRSINLIDVKTTSKPLVKFGGYYDIDFSDGSSKFHNGSFQSYRYYRQIAFYKRAIESKLIDLEDYVFNCFIVVVETTSPYLTGIYRVSEKWLEGGKQEYEKLLEEVAYSIIDNYKMENYYDI